MPSHDQPRPLKHQLLRPLLSLLTPLTLIAFGCDDEPPATESPSSGEMAGGVAGTMSPPVTTQGQLRVERPLANEVIATQVIQVEGSHYTASEVTVNGEVIAVTNQRFSTSVTFEDGPQQVMIAGGDDQVTLDILIDSTPPQVEIIEPTYGAHIDSAATSLVNIIGRATDEHSGVESVLVNGQEVLVESNGRFQFTYEPEPGLMRPLVIARDRAGHEASATRGFLYGRFKQWGLPLDRGARGVMKPEGFQVIEDTLEAALEGGLVNTLLAEVSGSSQDITIEEVIFQDIDVSLEPAQGYISVALSFYDLRVFFELASPNTRGDVYISPATLTAELHLAPKPDGTLDVQILNTEVSLENLNVQVNNSLLDAAVSFIEGFVSGLAEDALLATLESILVEELISPDLFSPRVNLLDVELQIHALMQRVEITPEQMTLEAGVRFDDLPVINDSIGYLYFPPMETPSPLMNMATLDIQQNAAHLFLSHLWRGGLLNFTLAEVLGEPPAMLQALLLNGFTSGQLVEFMAPTEVIGVRLRPSLPPVVRFDQTRPDTIVVDFVDLMIDLTLPDGRAWFTGGFDIIASVRPRLINNQLGLQVELSVDAVAIDEPLFPVKSEELLRLIEGLLEGLPSQLGPDGISNFFDLNELDFYGLTLTSGAVRAVSNPTPYLQIGLELGNELSD